MQLLPDPPTNVGAIAQLGERLLCKQEVTGSIPVGSISKGPCTWASSLGRESIVIAGDQRRSQALVPEVRAQRVRSAPIYANPARFVPEPELTSQAS